MTGPAQASGAKVGRVPLLPPLSPCFQGPSVCWVTDGSALRSPEPGGHTPAPRRFTGTMKPPLRRASRSAQEQSQTREKVQSAARRHHETHKAPGCTLFISLFFSQRCSGSPRWETISDSVFPLPPNHSPTSWRKPPWHPLKRVHCFLTSPAAACLPHLPPRINLLRNFLGE